MKKVLYLFVITTSIAVRAQTIAEKEAVMEPINMLFKGMTAGDSAMVHSAFTHQVTFVTIARNKNGQAVIVPDALDKFLDAVGTAHAEAWNEPVWDVRIEIDGIMAQAWAPYAFYLGNKFSHCGVDAFQLIKLDDGHWKIFHLADTRQREGCKVPDGVKRRFRE